MCPFKCLVFILCEKTGKICNLNVSDIIAFSINLRTKCVFLVMFRPPLPPCTHLYALVLTPPPPLDAYVINGRPLKERTLDIPFNTLPGSPFCVCFHIQSLFSRVGHLPNDQVVSYRVGSKKVRGTYKWFSGRLTKLSVRLGLDPFTTHSLRRGGASAMSDAGFSLIDIKNLGDWASLSVLHYLTKSPQAKLDLDRRFSFVFL